VCELRTHKLTSWAIKAIMAIKVLAAWSPN